MKNLYVAWYPTKQELDDQFSCHIDPTAVGGSVQEIEFNSLSQGLGICHDLNNETAKQPGHYYIYAGS